MRVIYTGRGMSRLEILTDAALTEKTGVTPAQYADFASLHGDASDGLPGVAGVGEKTAATLLASWGDLDGIVTAVADPDSAMGMSVRAKIVNSIVPIGVGVSTSPPPRFNTRSPAPRPRSTCAKVEHVLRRLFEPIQGRDDERVASLESAERAIELWS